VSAFCATHKLRGRFIAASSLHLPNKDQVVIAFVALHFYGLHCFDFLVFFSDNSHERFRRGARLDDFACPGFGFFIFRFLCVSAFLASQYERGASACFFGFKAAAAVWTKLHESKFPLFIFP
jgi:hypothetical protein